MGFFVSFRSISIGRGLSRRDNLGIGTYGNRNL